HAHLFLCRNSTDGILTKAKNNNVAFIVNVGTSIKNSLLSFELSKKHQELIPTIGIHPSEYQDLNNIDYMESLIEKLSFNAIGEIGLDYHWQYCSRELQIELLIKQLNLAKKYNLPVIIHNRKADTDILKITSKYPEVPMVFHCYSTDQFFAESVIAENRFFSFTGSITYSKKGKVVKTIKSLPLRNILIETDSPYMSPRLYRDKENEPAYIIETAKKISEIKSCSIEEVIKHTTSNAVNFFNIKV
ncbi:MAG: TatD family hydrolase, partial [bacterium]|nr:TatD family hydrolase [bacterium]